MVTLLLANAARRHSDVAVKVDVSLIHRDAEHICQIAAILLPLSTQVELENFESSDDTPPCTPITPSVSQLYTPCF